MFMHPYVGACVTWRDTTERNVHILIQFMCVCMGVCASRVVVSSLNTPTGINMHAAKDDTL